MIRLFVEKSKSFIKDSQNFIQKCKNKEFPPHAKLFTFDVVSLYTNIKHDKCIDILSDFFRDKFDDFTDMNIHGFREILKLVLFNNYFRFNGQYYKQIKVLLWDLQPVLP